MFHIKCISSKPAIICSKLKNKNTSIRCKTCSKLTIKTTRRRSSVFIVNFENISYLALVFLLLTLNRQIPAWLVLRNWSLFTVKFDVFRNNQWRFEIKLFVKILQKPQESFCVGVCFLIKLQVLFFCCPYSVYQVFPVKYAKFLRTSFYLFTNHLCIFQEQ